MTATETSAVDSAYVEEWRRWRATQEAARRDPHGFLAFTAIYSLGAAPQRLPGIPGEWAADEAGVRVLLATGEQLEIDGEAVAGECSHRFALLAEREERVVAHTDGVALEISRRGGTDMLRPLDPQSELLRSYTGTPAYEPNDSWLIRGEFTPYRPARDQVIETAVDGIVHSYPAVGELSFAVGGEMQRLVVFSPSFAAARGEAAEGFTFFTDATSGVTTYRASRTLSLVVPRDGGPVLIDFNRTRNLECAYTPYSPCSLAPAENRLAVAIEAGERIPVFAD